MCCRKKTIFASKMQFLLAAILCSVGVFVIMRLFDRFGVDNHQAIAVNYATAAVIGLLMCRHPYTPLQIPAEPWFGLSILTGFWFIFTYLLLAKSSQQVGVAVTSLSSKLSVVIPATMGIVLFQEHINTASAIGIILALTALYLIVGRKEKEEKSQRRGWALFPILIFFGTGIGDVLMKLTEQRNSMPDMNVMIAFIYFVALFFGIALIVVDGIKGKTRFTWKNLIGGILLGLVNYYSTFWIYRCMRLFDNVFLFPVYNIGVVMLTALAGLLLFKEKLTPRKLLGIATAIIAVILIALKP